MLRLRPVPLHARLAILVIAGLLTGVAPSARPLQQGTSAYTVYTAGEQRTLPFTSTTTHMVDLNTLATLFGFSVREDLLVEGMVGGLTITTTGQRILLIPGQSWAQISGEVRSLSGQVQGERGAWRVPVDFLSRALGPATGVPIEVRRGSQLVVVGDIRVPAISGRIERRDEAGRLVLNVRPATPHTVARNGNQLTIQFEAEALDMGAITGSAPEFIASTEVIGSALVVSLGPDAVSFSADDDQDDSELAIDLGAPAPAITATDPSPMTGVDPPVVDLAPPGVIRTVIIDPGHGGSDEGARGAGNVLEKDVTLQVALQLKAAIESRLGLRVVLTRDGDETVPLERRSALANNNKADLFLSLHANASFNSAVAGAQVVSLSDEDYGLRAPALPAAGNRVTVLGGGTRLVDAVPWDLAQLPHAGRSRMLAGILVGRFLEQGVAMFDAEPAQRPLRVLVGTNMPAIQVEMGFLTNPDDARGLRSGDRRTVLVDAIVSALTDVRRGIPEPPAEGGGLR